MQRDPALTGSSPLAGHGFNRAVAPRPLRPAPPCALEPPRPGDSCSLQGRGGERLRCLPVDLPRLRWKGGRGRAGGGAGRALQFTSRPLSTGVSFHLKS